MGKILTFEEYIASLEVPEGIRVTHFPRWLSLSKTAGKVIDPRDEAKPLRLDDMRYSVVPFNGFLDSVSKSIDYLDSGEQISPEGIKRIIEQAGISEALSLSGRFDSCQRDLQGKVEQAKSVVGQNLTRDEMNAVVANNAFEALLGFNGNYTIAFFGRDEYAYQNFCKDIGTIFPDWKVEKGNANFAGNKGPLLSVSIPANLEYHNLHLNPRGFGRGHVARADCWPSNYFTSRYHGNGIGNARFTRAIINAAKEGKMPMHVNTLQMHGVVGGSFYDPEYSKEK